MSGPVAIPLHASTAGSYGQSPGDQASASPISRASQVSVSPPVGGVYGSSPPSRSSSVEQKSSRTGAKRFWKRLRYDVSLCPSEFTVSIFTPISSARHLGCAAVRFEDTVAKYHLLGSGNSADACQC